MRTASMLLVLFIVLGFVRHAGAEASVTYDRDYTIEFGEHEFGFQDWSAHDTNRGDSSGSIICLGPFGYHRTSFTAAQGLIGFCFVLALLIVLPVVHTVRWKKKQVAN